MRASRYWREMSPKARCASMMAIGSGFSDRDCLRLISRFSRAAGRISASSRLIVASVTSYAASARWISRMTCRSRLASWTSVWTTVWVALAMFPWLRL